MSSTKIVFFGPIGKTRWPPWPLIGWDIFDFSKTVERIWRNLTGCKISMSSTKIVFFEPIGKTRWPPWPLIGWDIFNFCSETAERNSTKLDTKKDLNVLYQVCVFRADRKKQNGQSIKKVAHCTQVHDMWPFGPLVCSYKCVINIYWRINKKFLNNIAIFPKSITNDNVYFVILHVSLKITATALHLFAINIHRYFQSTIVAMHIWNWLWLQLYIGTDCQANSAFILPI